MTAIKIIVEFNKHVSNDQMASMTSSIAAYGNVFPGSLDRQFIVEVFRLSKAQSLRARLAQWEVHGFLRWTEKSSN